MLSSRGRIRFLIEPDSIHNARRSTEEEGKMWKGCEEKNLDAATAVMIVMMVMTHAAVLFVEKKPNTRSGAKLSLRGFKNDPWFMLSRITKK